MHVDTQHCTSLVFTIRGMLLMNICILDGIKWLALHPLV